MIYGRIPDIQPHTGYQATPDNAFWPDTGYNEGKITGQSLGTIYFIIVTDGVGGTSTSHWTTFENTLENG